MANTIDELPVFQKAQAFWDAVTAIIARPVFSKDLDLREQISEANDSITANMREGFEQSTDALFIKYLYYSKGSLAEVLERLGQARSKGYITDADLRPRKREGEELGRMLGGFIRYLAESDFKDRGRFNVKKRQKNRKPPGKTPGSPLSNPPADSGSDYSG